MLVFGHDGQVAHALRTMAAPDLTVTALGRAGADITDADAVRRAVEAARPDVAVNTAAYTAVDRAETEAEQAFAVNRDGAGHIAAACAAAGVPLIHYSTDYVFDGAKDGPWREDDPIAPLGVYGASKAAGEAAVRAAGPRHVILRTAWVFGAHGNNFVRTMLRLGAERERLGIVADQRGCPTAAADLASAAVAVARHVLATGEGWGTYHCCGAPPTTWHGFAEAIFEERRRATGLAPPRLDAIATADYPTPARRPANSVLDTARFAARFGLPAPAWRDALGGVVRQLLAA
ncbi:dTDP-4-dehydrorhamnose reductase [Azospirillum sp. TSO22-1]|uniref:dTDP-4-dehydrorhamnose reductase n=1 Tax=Azospirillum sp. TSO22-1 TaxID=716789 RepID=UPI000D646CAF|nr:dTDP-4-dehydrorhamnose reductase [Azospirillum sp. TSO22-1]